MKRKAQRPPARVRQTRNARNAASPVAKIAAPRLTGVYGRVRLFKALDSARKRPIIWISAPAGAGKTTLVASYLNARKLPCLWYQIDVRDLDPAAFFYYLREAIRKHSPRKRETLPLLTPEYLAGLPTFTRNFFEALFTRMRGPAAVVFDNFQDVPESAVLQQLLPEALSIIPERITVFILSRTSPPNPFARLQAQRAMQVLDADHLQLTLEEARGIARLHKAAALNVKTLAKLHEKVRGWTAGWILLLERLRETDLAVTDIPHEAREALFDYFAAELFNRAAPEVQTLLLKTSLLPQVAVSDAEALTSETRAAGILAELDRRNYFTTRLAANELVYQFHPLFREFLLARATQQLPASVRRSLQQKAAQILSTRGQYDEAATLLIESGDWESMCQLILTQAPILARQGRLATLEGWLRALPGETVEQQPWLLYWHGMACLAFDPAQGRGLLERAYAGFKLNEDVAGQFLACGGILSTYWFEWNDFTPTDRWMSELEMLVARCPNLVSPEIEAQVISSVIAVLYRQPQHPLLAAWSQRALELLRASTIPQQQVALSTFLLQLLIWRGDFQRCAALLREIEGMPDPRQGAPLMLIALKLWRALLYFLIAEHDAAFRSAEEALHIARESGVHLLDAIAYGYATYTALSAGDLDKAEDTLTRMEALVIPSRGMDVSFVYHLKSGLALLRGDLVQARHYETETLARVEAAGALFNVTLARIVLAQVQIELGEHETARRHLSAVRRFAEGMPGPHFVFIAWVAEANSLFRTGEQAEALATLARAFAIGRERDYLSCDPFWHPKVMARLCAVALEHGIEAEYATRLIRKRKLVAPSPEARNWPWPLKIHTLGGFRLEKDGEPVRFSGKVQRRPLDLLKITIALGGHEVDTQRIIDELWPEAEGDAAADALATALRRLRLLLGNPAALVLQDNKLTIDTQRVWVDVGALEHLFNRKDPAPAYLAQVLALYQGAFLEKEDASWVWPLRERLRHRFLRELTKQGWLLMQAKHYEEAIRLLEKGLDVDNLAEELYCNLMRCYQALGRRAEALSTYERCRKILSSTLGVTPSAETEALYQALRKS